MTVSPVLDAAQAALRRHCPGTTPASRPATRDGSLPPPPTVEEIVAVMRQNRDHRHGFRLRALIVWTPRFRPTAGTVSRLGSSTGPQSCDLDAFDLRQPGPRSLCALPGT
jgi:hypothetical protein